MIAIRYPDPMLLEMAIPDHSVLPQASTCRVFDPMIAEAECAGRLHFVAPDEPGQAVHTGGNPGQR